MQLSSLEGKKVALYGLARETLSLLELLQHRSIDFHYDLLNDSEVEKTPNNIITPSSTYIGPEVHNVINSYDLIIRSPGVSFYKEPLKTAKNHGTKVITANQIWWNERPQGKIIAVTGTKGKSTTTALIKHILQSTNHKVTLAGNIGFPLLSINNLSDIDYWILELSSYQLSDLQFSPDIALLLNLYPEHLDWHGNCKQYYLDKLQVFNDQKSKKFISKQALEEIKTLKLAKLDATEPLIQGNFQLPTLLGAHNQENLRAALTITQSCGISNSEAIKALETFTGLNHRLEVCFEKQGVTYVNDSISTIPQSTQAAIDSFRDRKIILIVGGRDRGLYWNDLARFIAQKATYTIGIHETGQKIIDLIKTTTNAYTLVNNLEEAVRTAKHQASDNSIVLYSPAAPSAPPYKNYEERGERFKQLVIS